MVLIGSSDFEQDSRLVAGVAFKKTFSYAGFEMQPKSYESPRIALLNIELELKSEKEEHQSGLCVKAQWGYLPGTREEYQNIFQCALDLICC